MAIVSATPKARRPLVYERVVPAVQRPSQAQRAAVLERPGTLAAHRCAFADFACLREIEACPPPVAAAAPDRARIAFWNAERLKYPTAAASLLGGLAADALLLCEVDVGMARTGQRHTVRDLAEALDAGFAFAVEYVELGLGDAREQAWHAGQTNDAGLHGAALLSPQALARPAVVRLETDGAWFDGGRGERRVGGRIAILGQIRVARRAVTLASVHLESHSDPDDRAAQMTVLLDAIDHYDPDAPVIVGGDFNTQSMPWMPAKDATARRALLADDPDRLVAPVRYEPLFAAAADRGYDWRTANLPEPTQRQRPDGTPAPPFGRIDWFFCRGLAATDPRTVPAVDADGTAISDHDALIVTVAPTGP